jgi:hypothetical protein
MLWRLLSPTRADLSEESAFLMELLDQTRLWRERLVQEIQLGSWTHLRLISSYQIEFPPELLSRYVNLKRATRANVLLPLTMRAKAPLLNFSLTGPAGAPAALTSRASTAALQAQYLGLLALTSRAADSLACIEPSVYEAVGAFTPGLYRDTFLKRMRGDHEQALAAYLSKGLGVTIGGGDVARWRYWTQRAGEILKDRLDEPADPLSCSEELLLAIPRMDPPPRSAADVEVVVKGFLDGVEAAELAGDAAFLGVLAEYGRRYEMIIETEVPLLEPSTIKIEEDLPLELSDRGVLTHTFPFGDARSTHLEIRSLDPSVEIVDYGVRQPTGEDASGWLESVRHSRDALIVYSSEPDRPYYAMLSLRLRTARHLIVTVGMLIIANVGAMVAALVMPTSESYVDRLAILVVPTTIAAAFVLYREQTALATRLQWLGSRGLLAATTVVLWMLVLVCLITYDDPADQGRPTNAGQLQTR